MIVRKALLVVSIISTAAFYATNARAEILIATASPMAGGAQSWGGEQFERGAGMAVEDLNAKGGVLGQNVELIVGDDFCDPDQAVALARKLVSDGVVFVAGASVLALLDRGREGLRRSEDPYDLPGLFQCEADRRRWPERVPGERPGRPVRGDGRRLPRRALGEQRDRDSG